MLKKTQPERVSLTHTHAHTSTRVLLREREGEEKKKKVKSSAKNFSVSVKSCSRQFEKTWSVEVWIFLKDFSFLFNVRLVDSFNYIAELQVDL